MNKKSHAPFLFFPLITSLAMLFFTFFQVGWFSDRNGFKAYFEIPVRTEGGLDTFADLIWMAAPFALFIGIFLASAGGGKALRAVSVCCVSLPLSLYALLQIFSFLGEKEGHFSLLVTDFFLILCGSLAIACVFIPELRRFAAQLTAAHIAVEILLLILSFAFEEKYSQFYFSQLLPMGRFSGFRYTFFLLSVFLYHLFYSLSLLFFLLRKETALSPSVTKAEARSPSEAEEEPDFSKEDSEEDEPPLSLQDFGIEK